MWGLACATHAEVADANGGDGRFVRFEDATAIQEVPHRHADSVPDAQGEEQKGYYEL